MLTLDQIQTVAFAGLFLFVGYGILRAVPILARTFLRRSSAAC